MVATWVIEPTDVLGNCAFSLPPRFPTVPPYQLSLDGFEERLHYGTVVTIALAAHRDLEAMLG